MEQHVKVLGVLNIVWGAMGALAGLVILIIFGGAYGIVGAVSFHAPEAAIAQPIIAMVGGIIALFLLILSVPSIIAGVGLLYFKPWARILGIIISAVHLVNIPFGTALGIYGLWVLFSPRSLGIFTPGPAVQTGA